MIPGKLIAATALVTLIFAGGNEQSRADESNKVRVGYIGLTCEASIFSAVENGFFKEEGLEIELIKCDWKTYKDSLALGSYDFTQHLVMYFLKPIEQGLDVKFLGGVHTGCLRVQVPTNSPIKSVADLRGKRIGVPGMGTPPFIFATRAASNAGLNPAKDIEWKVYPPAEQGLAIEKGEVDAVANAEPIGSMLLGGGKVRNLADQAKDPPYNTEYCCEVVANGRWLAKNPKAAAASTRALLKGAKWVQTNPVAAAKMAVEKKYLAANPELNAVAISHLNYLPSISRAESSVRTAAEEMKKAGMLTPQTDPAELAKRAFMHLDGVTDEWIEKTEVKKVAGGRILPPLDAATVSSISKVDDACCARKLASK